MRLPLTAQLLPLLIVASLPTPTRADEVELILTGTERLERSRVLRALGQPPDDRAVAAWATEAAARVAALYKTRMYSQVRVFHRVDKDNTVRFDVDEGRVELAIIGANTLQNILFRVDLHLPGSIFHKPTVDRSIAELRAKYRLTNAYYRVIETRPPVANRLGQLVPRRELRVYVIPREAFGWRFSVAVSSTWGILPKGGYGRRDLLFERDRLDVGGGIAVPFRQFFFEQSPRFQWVHGELELGYRLPHLWRRRLAPMAEMAMAFSRYVRSDGRIDSYLQYHVEGLASTEWQLGSKAQLSLGVGADHTRVFDLHLAADASTPVFEERLTRYLVRLEGSYNFDSNVLRRDQRDELRARVGLAISDAGTLLFDARLWLTLVFNFGEHDLVARARGVFLAGDVRFWNEVELAGEYQRAFFDNRFWVRQAAQGTIAFRYAINRTIKLGLYHDLSLFVDQSRGEPPLAVANAFGPSAHFLLFDLFSLDLHYAFGFAPVAGFSHNFYFQLQNAF